MGWYVVESKPPKGPCTAPCEHSDCTQDRKLVAGTCLICEKPIGFDTKFVFVNAKAGTAKHFVCALNEAKK